MWMQVCVMTRTMTLISPRELFVRLVINPHCSVGDRVSTLVLMDSVTSDWIYHLLHIIFMGQFSCASH